MNLHAIALLEDSLEKAMQEEETAVALFYSRLLTLDPTLHQLLPMNREAHGRFLFAFLRQYVNGLSAPHTIIPLVKALGHRHARQSVAAHHYHTFCQALLWSLARQLGCHFTPETAEAWTEALYLLTGLMKEAGADSNGS